MKKCEVCSNKSVPGLVPGVGLCQYHFDVRFYGREWADYCHSRTDRAVQTNGLNDQKEVK